MYKWAFNCEQSDWAARKYSRAGLLNGNVLEMCCVSNRCWNVCATKTSINLWNKHPQNIVQWFKKKIPTINWSHSTTHKIHLEKHMRFKRLQIKCFICRAYAVWRTNMMLAMQLYTSRTTYVRHIPRMYTHRTLTLVWRSLSTTVRLLAARSGLRTGILANHMYSKARGPHLRTRAQSLTLAGNLISY